ncbi:hypothetical protein [Catellatospora chokoriensis]|uniref:Uncharacterized protein n=1 Tax=Catellatospora chokoriensis TaxID=310353 RepID=A0A8J3K8C3_9ACTN|nr:hypothetical protein [Catellatospora chokoriensis]GIF90354.1 hypothetical protein Cch02nite_37980 [Catellatospora chokoriensis]
MNQPDRPHPGPPRWVKISAIIALLLAAVFAAIHLIGNMPTHGGH